MNPDLSNMNIGLQAELMTLPSSTRVLRHKNYLVFETQSRPDFSYGNSVFFLGSSPRENQKFIDDYKSEHLGSHNTLAHFEYRLDQDIEQPKLNYVNVEIVFQFENTSLSQIDTIPTEVKILKIDPEKLIQGISGLVFDEYSDGKPDDFLSWRLKDYRDKILRMEGAWYGLYRANELISSCGVFRSLGYNRFQMLITKKQYRRLGYGTFLLKSILQEVGSDQKTIIIAGEGSIGSYMYPKIGFQRKSIILSTKI